MTSSIALGGMPPDIDVAGARSVRHPWRWVASVVLIVLALQFTHMLVTNDNFEWGVVGSYMTSQIVGAGLLMTIQLTVFAMAIGTVGGVLVAIGRLSDNPILRSVCSAYVWFFRGTPLLVQLIFWYNMSVLMPEISLGIPFGPSFVGFDTNSLISPLTAAILGLGLNEVAYMAEIVRAGLIAVDNGQSEAASALGMSKSRALRRIVLSQAMRFIVPPSGSQLISMLKATSLVSVIALADLLYTVQSVYHRTFQTIPLLLVACIWYLIFTSILYVGQTYIERYYARGSSKAVPTRAPSIITRLWKRSAT